MYLGFTHTCGRSEKFGFRLGGIYRFRAARLFLSSPDPRARRPRRGPSTGRAGTGPDVRRVRGNRPTAAVTRADRDLGQGRKRRHARSYLFHVVFIIIVIIADVGRRRRRREGGQSDGHIKFNGYVRRQPYYCASRAAADPNKP